MPPSVLPKQNPRRRSWCPCIPQRDHEDVALFFFSRTKLIVLARRVKERTYAPGGIGFIAAEENFGRAAKSQRIERTIPTRFESALARRILRRRGGRSPDHQPGGKTFPRSPAWLKTLLIFWIRLFGRQLCSFLYFALQRLLPFFEHGRNSFGNIQTECSSGMFFGDVLRRFFGGGATGG